MRCRVANPFPPYNICGFPPLRTIPLRTALLFPPFVTATTWLVCSLGAVWLPSRPNITAPNLANPHSFGSLFLQHFFFVTTVPSSSSFQLVYALTWESINIHLEIEPGADLICILTLSHCYSFLTFLFFTLSPRPCPNMLLKPGQAVRDG